MFAENTSAYLADFGVPATFTPPAGTYTFGGIVTYTFTGSTTFSAVVLFDEPSADVVGGRAQTTEYEITFRTADLPGISLGGVVTIGGVAYTVLSSNTLNDGVFSNARLEV